MAYSNYYAASGLFHGSMSSVMGTQFDILMVGSDPRLLGTVWEKVESEVQRLDKMLNGSIRRVRFHLLTGKPDTIR